MPFHGDERVQETYHSCWVSCRKQSAKGESPGVADNSETPHSIINTKFVENKY